MPGRVGRGLGQRDHSQIDVGDHQPLHGLFQTAAKLRTIGRVDARIATADQQKLLLHLVLAQQLVHGRGDHRAGRDHKALALHRVDLAHGVVHVGTQRMRPAAIDRKAGPGTDVDLLVLRIHRILGERLQMLPAAEHAHLADGRVDHVQIAAVPIAEHRALDMRGTQFAARHLHLPGVVEQRLRDVETAARALAETHRQPEIERARRIGQALEFRRAERQRIVEIALHILHADGRRGQPDPPRITGNPGLGKRHQLHTLARGLLHHHDGLVDGRVDVQKNRRGLHCGNAQLGMVGCRHGQAFEGEDIALCERKQ